MNKRVGALILSAVIAISPSYALASTNEQSQLKPGTKIETQSIDDKVMTYFNDIDDSLSETFSKKNVSELKDEAFKKFSIIVDFTFYGKEINGVKFSDLKDETKAKILGFFTHYFPDFEEDMTKAYSQFNEDMDTFLSKADQKLLDVIGQENYDKLKDISDSIKDITKKATDKGKQYAKKGLSWLENWYQDKKNGN